MCFLSVHAAPTVLAQVAVDWQRCYGGSERDMARSVRQTYDGGYIAVGTTESMDGDVVGFHGEVDIWVLRLDPYGEMIWQRCLGGTGTEGANDVIQTSDGGFVIAGSTSSTDGDVTGLHGSIGDAWLIKLDGDGSIIWQRCYGGTGLEIANQVKELAGGGYVFVGEEASTDGDVSGDQGGVDCWLVHVDAYGEPLFSASLGGTGVDKAYTIDLCSDGGFIIGGTTWSDDGQVTGYHGQMDMWLMRVSSAGDLLWQRCLGGTSQDWLQSVRQRETGDFILAGYTYSDDGDISGNHGDWDFWVSVVNEVGEMTWQRCLGGSDREWAHSVELADDGGAVITGFTRSNDGQVSGNHGSDDAWVVKLGSGGDFVWQKCFGGGSDEWPRCISAAGPGSYILAAHTLSGTSGDVLCGSGLSERDFWLARITPSDVMIPDNRLEPLGIYPQPASDIVVLQLPNRPFTDEDHILLIDAQGRICQRLRVSGPILSISLHGLSAGPYTIQLRGTEVIACVPLLVQ